jgi:hypothetical protein
VTRSARSWPLSRKTIVIRAVALAVAGLAIYLLLPSLTRVLASWPRLLTLDRVWLVVALAAEVASFTCTFALQRLALQTRQWFPVVTAGLTGNSVSGILRGGAAAGAGLQFEMLSNAGFDTDAAAGALTAFSLLEVGALLAMPVVVVPAVLAGTAISPGLEHTTLLGLGMFCLLAVVGVVLLKTDRPLAAAGRAAQALRNRITRGRRPPLTGLDTRLLSERDTIRSVLGHNWWQALLLTVGRLGSISAACWPPCAPPAPIPGTPWCCWPTRPQTSSSSCRSPQAASAWSKPAWPACLCWPACTAVTRSWPHWPTGSPPTGFRCAPDRRPTSCTGTATAAGTPVPALTTRHNGRTTGDRRPP